MNFLNDNTVLIKMQVSVGIFCEHIHTCVIFRQFMNSLEKYNT